MFSLSPWSTSQIIIPIASTPCRHAEITFVVKRDGIDVYFENVGGKHLDAACGQMRALGRIPVCGMISGYNNKGARSEGVTTLSNMIYNRVMMRGFVVYEFNHMRDQFLKDMRTWMAEGRMKYSETIMHGIDQAPNALIGLLEGKNTGKMLVKLAEDD